MGAVKKYFEALTGLRALAAYMVFGSHFIPFERGTWAASFIHEWHFGVSIFFVLSGFLIAYHYADQAQLSKKWLKNYFFSRFARIYPIYFLLTTLSFLYSFWVVKDYAFLGVPNQIGMYIANITFLRGFLDDIKFTLIGQGWSLTVEECFYALAPIIFLYRHKFPLILQSFFWLLVGVLLVEIGKRIDFYGFFGNYSFMFSYSFFGRNLDFLMGVGLAIFYKKNNEKIFKLRWLPYTYWGVFALLVCNIILAYLHIKYNENQSFHSLEGLLTYNILIPLSVSLFFWGLLTEKTYISSILASRPMVVLGKSSYSFYLLHLGYLSNNFPNYGVKFIAINLIAIALFCTVEEPLHRYFRKNA